jgi:hypothetical protein
MTLKLFSVEKVLIAEFAGVVLRGLFVNAEHVLFEIVAFGEGLERKKGLLENGFKAQEMLIIDKKHSNCKNTKQEVKI